MTNPQNKKSKTPWPTKKAMEQVYEKKLWGTNDSQFYSGEGSHDPNIVLPYIEKISAFLKAFKTPVSICDLGCGDFNIGRQLLTFTKQYHAIDIAEPLIAFNKSKFKAENLEFQCLDIAKDKLPQSDVIILRQVLQHLSNAEIKQVTNKLTNYKYVILTEHLPNGDFEPNKDIISGQGIRLKKKSGVSLLEVPFNLKIKTQQELLRIDLGEKKGVIVTWVYEMF